MSLGTVNREASSRCSVFCGVPGKWRRDWKEAFRFANKGSLHEIWTHLGRLPTMETILEDSLLERTHQEVMCRVFCLKTIIEE